MKTKFTFLILAGTIFSLIFFACKKTEDGLTPVAVKLELPSETYDYSTVNNGGFDMFTGVDNDMATLGRVLFYDTRLSVNNSISCGSCHKQSIAFSDDMAFSKGFENHSTLRNTLPIQNLSNALVNSFSSPSLFWDGRAKFLNTMVLMPIVNHVEMGMSDMDGIVEKVKAQPFYADLFNKVQSSDHQINIQNISNAISAFVSSIFSGNTRFDRYRNGLTTLNGMEEQGRVLFFSKYNCNGCHQTQQLNGYETGGGFVNIGLEDNYTDNGLENISQNQGDNGKFKIPNLRNIALTAPYMHDGRFSTLNEVMDHYSNGIKNHPALDDRLKDANGQAKKMNITTAEKTALIAFLNTLTDYEMITNPKYSNPFTIR